MNTDPRVDDYIAKSADFAQPVLHRIRELVHVACPEVEETIKWGAPSFSHHGILCGMASFKAHCVFGFWKSELVLERFQSSKESAGEAMSQFGHLRTVKDLPPRSTMLRLVRLAAELNEAGIKAPTPPKASRPKAVRAPADLLAALQNNALARAGYDDLSPSQKREYIEWITEAKRDETRKRRVATAVEWMAEGRIRNWRYVR
jgi:uncharacterized protein YdeI (YjbR/CyaY-like superfamily)